MSSWMRTNWNFELPGITFKVNARTLAAKKICLPNTTNPEEMAKYVEHLIYHFRPNLNDGKLMVVGIHCPGMDFHFTVLHPSFPKTPVHGQWPKERLELCKECGKPLGEVDYMRHCPNPTKPGYGLVETVCSQECANKPMKVEVGFDVVFDKEGNKILKKRYAELYDSQKATSQTLEDKVKEEDDDPTFGSAGHITRGDNPGWHDKDPLL